MSISIVNLIKLINLDKQNENILIPISEIRFLKKYKFKKAKSKYKEFNLDNLDSPIPNYLTSRSLR